MRACLLAAALLASGCTALLDLDKLDGTGRADGGSDLATGGGDGGTPDLAGSDGGKAALAFAAQPYTYQTSSGRGYDVRIAETNQDSAPDILVANYGENSLAILLQDVTNGAAAGTFHPTTMQYAVCTDPSSMFALVDPKNANLEVVVSCPASTLSDAAITYLVESGVGGNGEPSFARSDVPVGMSPLSIRPQRAVPADLDGDGQMDLVIADGNVPETITSTKAYLTLSFGGSTTPTHIATPFDDGYLYDLVVADFNHDGKLDVAVSSSADAAIALFLNTGAPRATFFAPATLVAAPGSDGPFIAADLDGKNGPDLLYTAFDLGKVVWLLSNGDGTFASPRGELTDPGPIPLAVGDFDKDGKLDVAVGAYNAGAADYEARVDVFLGDGTGALAKKVDVTGILPSHGDSIAAGDLNGDGLDDIVLGSSAHPQVYVLLNTSK